MRILHYTLILLVIIGLLPSPISAKEITKEAILADVNDVRIRSGLQPFIENDKLSQAAFLKGQDMVRFGYWSHGNPITGLMAWDFIRAVGYHYTFAGENLARFFTQSEEVVAGWLESPSHKELLTSDQFKDVGIAVLPMIVDGVSTELVVQLLGTTE